MKKLKFLDTKKNTKIKENCIELNISKDISINKEILYKIYEPKLNIDMIFREFSLSLNNIEYDCLLVFIEGLTDSDSINNFILKPLMFEKEKSNKDLFTFIETDILSQGNIKKLNTFKKVVELINFGYSALFVDTLDTCFISDTKSFEHREISKPVNELVVKGSHEAFVESLKSNVSVLRRLISNENLVLEKILVGKKNKKSCVIGYISSIANPTIIDEVRNRLNNISIDFLLDSNQLQHYIEDHPFIFEPQILSTERPDKVVSHLTEGRVCIIVDNSPNVLVVPFTFWDFFHSSEDYNIKFQFGNFIRIIRLVAYFFSLFLPAIYIALTSYHVYLLPTDLLFSISAIKEQIPFPLLIEILIMELSFELIREASTRMPGSIGSSLGIVGAVLLGQASVDAKLVSPILILVVAITGISSFATPDYSFALSYRLMRFGYILLASIAGFLGILFGIIIHFTMLTSIYTFGIPYFVSFNKYQKKPFTDGILLSPVWLNSFRPPFLSQLDKIKSAKISRKWKKRKET